MTTDDTPESPDTEADAPDAEAGASDTEAGAPDPEAGAPDPEAGAPDPEADAPDTEVPAETGEAEEVDVEQLRKENERLTEQLADEHLDKTRKRRRRASIALAVVVALLLPPAVITVWTRNRMLNTDVYVETVAPLAKDPTIKKAVSARLSSEITKAVDIKKLAQEYLPEKAAPLSGFIAAGGNNLITQLTDKAIESDQFVQVWDAANREAHKKLVLLLKGEQGTVVDYKNGEVAIPLQKLADTVLGKLKDATGIDIAGRIPKGALSGEFVLFRSTELAKIQSAVKLFNRVAWALVIISLGALVATVLVAEKLRLGVRRAGVALTVSTALTLIAIAVGRGFYINALTGKVQSLAAAGNAFDIIINFMRVTLRAFLALGVVLIVGAWAAGPSAAAERVRSWGRALLGRADEAAGDRDLGPVPRFVHRYEHPLEWGVAGIGIAVLIAMSHPTGLNVVVVALMSALAFGLIRLLGAVARPGGGASGPGGGDGVALAGANAGGEPSSAGAAEGVEDDGVEDG